jgi:polyribonucleotide 5'-hydroxyl-kinase
METKTTAQEVEEYKLDAESELRFEVEDETVMCELKSGLAEVFGTELMKGHKYSFRTGSKVAVFTYHGCCLALYGKPEVAYVSKETPMTFYVNLSAALEEIRRKAQEEDTYGPTVMIVGPTDCGKSTLCRILLNYSVRLGRTPVFVDLDCGQGCVSIPGSLGAVVVERPADVEDGFSLVAPIVYHFGHTGPAGNVTLYNMIINTLSQSVKLKMESDSKVKYSGVVINTCGWVKSHGYQAIIKAAQDFNVDLIAVLDQERLYNELVRDVSNTVKVCNETVLKKF